MARAALAEALGTGALLTVVVGSGVMGQQLSGGTVGVALIINALSTGAALVVLLTALGPVSGAHFNPAVTLVMALRGRLPWGQVPAYVASQLGGGMLGVWTAHAMFGLDVLQRSTHARSGPGLGLGEVVATAGLLLTIEGVSRARPAFTPAAVGLYILSAYFFTSSTSFANPSVTLARTLTDTFTGIRAADAPGFIVAQVVGAVTAGGVAQVLWPDSARSDEATSSLPARSRHVPG